MSILLLLAYMTGVADAANTTLESRVKAAFIFNFAKFIDWPNASFPSLRSPIVVCVMGADPFEITLNHTLEGKTAHGRPFLIRHQPSQEPPRPCKILFIGPGETRHVRQILDAARGKSIVTVSDLPGFDQKGGMIRFFLQANKVRFAINLEAVRAARVHVSSQLLKVSKLTRSQ